MENIIQNRDRLLSAVRNRDNNEIIDLLIELGEIPEKLKNGVQIKMCDLKRYIVPEKILSESNINILANIILFIFSIRQNDFEFIQELISFNNSNYNIDFRLMNYIYEICDDKMFQFILENNVNSLFISHFSSHIISNGNRNRLELLFKYGFINQSHISLAISENNIDAIKFLIEVNFENIQEAINVINYKEEEEEGEGEVIFFRETKIEMIQLLCSNGFTFDKNLNSLFEFAINRDDIELVKFCLEYNLELCDINFGLSLENFEITKLLISYGADINLIKDEECLYRIHDIRIIKFLIEECGYNFHENHLAESLAKMINQKNKIDDLIYITEIGINMNLSSFIKSLAQSSNMDYVKYLINNHMNKFNRTINVILPDCFKYGNIELAKLLSNYSQFLSDKNRLERLFYTACEYKKYDSVKYLIELGLDLNKVDVKYMMEKLNSSKCVFCDDKFRQNIIDLLIANGLELSEKIETEIHTK